MTALTLPNPAKIAATDLNLARVQAANPSRGGDYQTVELAEPLWRARISTARLTAAQSGAWAAFFAKTRGGARTVYVYDAERPRPLAFANVADLANGRAGVTDRRVGLTTLRVGRSVAPWGSPWISVVNRTAGLVDTFGWTPGAALTPGDWIACDDGPARRLFMIVDPAVADANGRAQLSLEPRPPAALRSIVPIRTVTELAAFEAVLSNMSKPATVDGLSAASFDAAQIIRRF